MTKISRKVLHTLAAGDDLFADLAAGKAWMLLEGLVRLDRAGSPPEEGFAGVAVSGDILGAEVLLLGKPAFHATALTPCSLRLWADAGQAPDPSALLHALVSVERRSAEALALRCGEANARVERLVTLFAKGKTKTDGLRRPTLPRLKDMAEMTALTVGTVSRTLARMQAEGSLAAPAILRGRPRLRD